MLMIRRPTSSSIICLNLIVPVDLATLDPLYLLCLYDNQLLGPSCHSSWAPSATAPGPLLPQFLGPSCLYHNQLLGVSYHGRGTSSSDSPQLPGPSCQLQCLLGTWSLGRCLKHRTATTIAYSPIVVVSWLLGSPRSGQSCSRWASLRTPAIGSGTQSSGTRPSGRGTSWMWSGLDQRTRAGSWRLT